MPPALLYPTNVYLVLITIWTVNTRLGFWERAHYCKDLELAMFSIIQNIHTVWFIRDSVKMGLAMSSKSSHIMYAIVWTVPKFLLSSSWANTSQEKCPLIYPKIHLDCPYIFPWVHLEPKIVPFIKGCPLQTIEWVPVVRDAHGALKDAHVFLLPLLLWDRRRRETPAAVSELSAAADRRLGPRLDVAPSSLAGDVFGLIFCYFNSTVRHSHTWLMYVELPNHGIALKEVFEFWLLKSLDVLMHTITILHQHHFALNKPL